MSYFLGKIFRFFLVVYVGVFFFLLVRPFPEKLSSTPTPIPITPTSVEFLADVTYVADSGAERLEETIFPKMLEMVKGAKHFVYADMFLFNGFQGKDVEIHREQTRELADALIAKKTTVASATVVMMTDPINRGYGGIVNSDLDRMEAAGVQVFETPLEKLRDSNLLWSTIYRGAFQWMPNTPEHGWLPNPLSSEGEKVTFRTYARLFNFKANHRKVLVVDTTSGGKAGLVTLIGSLNPHTASSRNGNTALLVRNTPLAEQVLASERALVALGEYPPLETPSLTPSADPGGEVTATYLSEASIEKSIVRTIGSLEMGEKLDIAVFYLSDRHVIRAIEKAAARGVSVRILLDANDSAFGRRKHGIPNRQTAERLTLGKKENLQIRWCNTHGEQCHAKMLLATGGGKSALLIGSANYTRRNLDKYNLEAAILVESTVPVKAVTDAHQYFEQIWNNEKGETSVSLDVYRDRASWKRLMVWIMEHTGLSTF